MTYREELESGLSEASESLPPRPGQVLVVGCGTSEILGARIGSASSPEVASEIMEALARSGERWRISLALQCCEHLNRALVLERPFLGRQGLVEVLAVPQVCARGALAAIAHHRLRAIHASPRRSKRTMVLTTVNAHWDALEARRRPGQGQPKRVGAASLTIARTRPPLVGGKRAQSQGNHSDRGCRLDTRRDRCYTRHMYDVMTSYGWRPWYADL